MLAQGNVPGQTYDSHAIIAYAGLDGLLTRTDSLLLCPHSGRTVRVIHCPVVGHNKQHPIVYADGLAGQTLPT